MLFILVVVVSIAAYFLFKISRNMEKNEQRERSKSSDVLLTREQIDAFTVFAGQFAMRRNIAFKNGKQETFLNDFYVQTIPNSTSYDEFINTVIKDETQSQGLFPSELHNSEELKHKVIRDSEPTWLIHVFLRVTPNVKIQTKGDREILKQRYWGAVELAKRIQNSLANSVS